MDKKLQQVADDVLSKLTNDIYKLINDNMLFGYNDKDDVFYTLSNKEIIDNIKNNLEHNIWICEGDEYYKIKTYVYLKVNNSLSELDKINKESLYEVLNNEIFNLILGKSFVNTYDKLPSLLMSIKQSNDLINKDVDKQNITDVVSRLLEITDLIKLFISYSDECEKFINDDEYDTLPYVMAIKRILFEETLEIANQWTQIINEHSELIAIVDKYTEEEE